jgi:hypothetical protein
MSNETHTASTIPKPRGGNSRLRMFARLIQQGVQPPDAFRQAGFPIKGVDGCEKGWLPSQIPERAHQLARSEKVQRLIEDWKVARLNSTRRLLCSTEAFTGAKEKLLELATKIGTAVNVSAERIYQVMVDEVLADSPTDQ